MTRDLPVLGSALIAQPATTRKRDVRQGIWIESVTIVWMVIEASVAISVGFATRSVSLQGFGIDSIVELIAGGILLWRLLIEQQGGSVERIEQAEKRASWVTAFSLFALAVYIVGDSAWSFFTHTRPEASWWGVGLAIAAALIMPLLWQGKLRIARRIGSAALKADAACSVTCAYMSLTLLAGLLLNRFFGWWWADPLAALGLVYFLIQEGREALHEAQTGETCHCGHEECHND
ncbi:cation transporter [Tengunoibacter tsumagoiensis]|uniref:Putative conserved integral membrane protein n=1 Tax=Tengunoibacter tsumagoiensis TaxID=2014871 RepID=A0A401ZY46_9CHLR|nr:cation transporter [Tengunoibacter tsumagoiensis]GCE11784.1 putative conserved integral membrane protein [Tengunoibacter tsumagoiensis]